MNRQNQNPQASTLGTTLLNFAAPYAVKAGLKVLGYDCEPFKLTDGNIDEEFKIYSRSLKGTKEQICDGRKDGHIITGFHCMESDNYGQMTVEVTGGGIGQSYIILKIIPKKGDDGKTWSCDVTICGKPKSLYEEEAAAVEKKGFHLIEGTIDDKWKIETKSLEGRGEWEQEFREHGYIITGIQCTVQDDKECMKANVTDGGIDKSYVTLKISPKKGKNGKKKPWHCDVIIYGKPETPSASAPEEERWSQNTSFYNDPKMEEFSTFRDPFFTRTRMEMSQKPQEEEHHASEKHSFDDPEIRQFSNFRHPLFTRSRSEIPQGLENGGIHTETVEETGGNGLRRTRTVTVRRTVSSGTRSFNFNESMFGTQERSNYDQFFSDKN